MYTVWNNIYISIVYSLTSICSISFWMFSTKSLISKSKLSKLNIYYFPFLKQTLEILIFVVYIYLFILFMAIYVLEKNNILNLDYNIVSILGVLGILSIIIYGVLNSKTIKVIEYSLNINKKNTRKNIKLALISDLHIDQYRDKNRAKRIVDKINTLNADCVILAGDIFDNGNVVLDSKNADYLKNFNSTLVLGVLGNHEYYGDPVKTINYLEKINIKILLDDIFSFENISILGRIDNSSRLFKNLKQRKNLNTLFKNTDDNKIKIVISHQPSNIEEYIENNVDIALFGHTHKGQYFPFNLLINFFHKISYGYKKINNSHLVVSSGVGDWGPQFRLGTKSEIVLLDINFN